MTMNDNDDNDEMTTGEAAVGRRCRLGGAGAGSTPFRATPPSDNGDNSAPAPRLDPSDPLAVETTRRGGVFLRAMGWRPVGLGQITTTRGDQAPVQRWRGPCDACGNEFEHPFSLRCGKLKSYVTNFQSRCPSCRGRLRGRRASEDFINRRAAAWALAKV